MANLYINYCYLFSALCFIFSLKGLSSPQTARNGNLIGIIGMLVAIMATFMRADFYNYLPVIIAVLIGGVTGVIIALRIKMTAMPQLVAGFHSFVGLAAVLVALSALLMPESYDIGTSGNLPWGNLLEMSLGASIGGITFTGSIIAFAKLQALMTAKPIIFRGQKYFNILITLIMISCFVYFIKHESILLFTILIILSFIMGVLLILPVGGADMPVIVSMLNSYSGWAAAGIGFTLGNSLLIITGALVGASGAILSYIMCRAMNRSLLNVIFGAFKETSRANVQSEQEERYPNISSAEDAAYMVQNADSVIIVPGYGMAVAQAQHAIKDLTTELNNRGIKTRFAIHPVAGRMPGHMNVLLAEANVDYEDVYELDEINQDFINTDIVIVIGANDITNPAAKTDPESPIYGMPILEVAKAGTVFFIKRSMSPGYAGIENELFYNNNTQMIFGDAKKVIESFVKCLI